MSALPPAGVATAPTACVSCGSASVRALGEIPPGDEFAGRRLERPRPGGRLWACASCFLRFRYPRPTKAELDELYRRGASDHWRHAPAERADWLAAARWIRARPAGARVLDVGCFDGAFLDHLGEDYRRSGIEIHEDAARRARARGVEIVGGDLAAIPAGEGFDVVVAFDVVEHAHDPFALLAALAAATRPGGWIVISTGNPEAPSWRFMGSRYWYCTVAEHLSFVGPRWCRHAAARLGLRIEAVESFAHRPATLPRRVADCGRNVLYRLAPGLAGWLRARGAGGKDVARHPELLSHPPDWMSARDHFIARFGAPPG